MRCFRRNAKHVAPDINIASASGLIKTGSIADGRVGESGGVTKQRLIPNAYVGRASGVIL